MVVNKVFEDPRGVDCVYCYTDTAIPLDSIITFDGVSARISKVFTAEEGWNPGPGNSNQGVIGFNYTGQNYTYGDTFVINTSAGNTTVSNYAPISYLYYSDGSSLDGWTFSNTSVYEFMGNPVPSLFWPFGGGVMYRDFGQSFINKTIQFDVNFSGSAQKLTMYFGCNSSGAGPTVVLRLNGTQSGFGYFTSSWSSGTDAITNITNDLNNWATIKIVTNSGALNTAQLYVNNVLTAVTNEYIAIGSDTWWGFRSGAVNIDNLYIFEGSV